ncbi:hypothetical protein KUV46_06625 [Thalassovita mediterranea]|nr:hypothetical protein KUV46_06625 [Thalassovita mediterranea]
MTYRRFTVLIASAAICAGAASAQNVNRAAEQTAACLEIEDAAARLSCFETAARELSNALESDEAATPAPQAQTNEPSVPSWAQAPEPEPEPAPKAEDDDRRPVWARLMPRPDPEQLDDSISVSVTRILRNATGRHFFIMSDGSEWEQVAPGGVKPPSSLPAAATISDSLVGNNPGLTFDDGPNGRYRVRRVK